MHNDITSTFCVVDDIVKNLISLNSNNYKIASYGRSGDGVKPGPKPKLNISEIATIIIYYHESHYDCFKHYYKKKILVEHKQDFDLVSYTQFIKLISKSMYMIAMILTALLKKCTGTSFVDSSSIEVCKTYRINRHKVFGCLAKRSKTTKGWFYGFKVHLVITPTGDLVKVKFSSWNKDDRKALERMTEGLFGKIFGDRGYIGKDFANKLKSRGIQMITRLKKGMKNILMDMDDKIMLLKRSLIETVIGKIKFLGKFEHSRHRSPQNAFAHMIGTLINYQLHDKKPSIVSLLEEY